jgi:DNA-binding transcriptional LysR family regulator
VPLIAVSRVPLPSAHEEIERCLQGLGVRLQIVMEAFTPWEALGYVEQKVGICLLARSSAVMRPGIAIRPLDSHLLVRKSGMFVREDNHHPLLKRFMDMAIEKTAVLRQRPQANA